MLRLLSMTQVDGSGRGQAPSADRILAQIADPARPCISARVLIVVAHPDDETLGCGALLPRLDDVRLVHVTDGAPRTGDDALRQGFATPQAYAAARRAELEAALQLAGIAPDRLICLGIADQEAALQIAAIARRLVPLIAEAEIVLTHAFERGHPDHDAVAVAVDAACALIGRDRAPAVVEMPFYRADPDSSAWIRQAFGPSGPGPIRLVLNEAERARKLAMLDAHATQRDTLASFGAADETFRPASAIDLTCADDLVLYDRFGWEMTSARFRAEAIGARRELGLERP